MTKRWLCLLISLVFLYVIAACSAGRVENVQYDVYRLPVSDFYKMDILGISETKGLSQSYVDFLQKNIDRCHQYEKTTQLKVIFPLPDGDRDAVTKSFSQSVEKFQNARYVHGVLSMEIIKNSVKKKTTPATLVTVGHKLEYKWYDSYGNAAHPKHQSYGAEEIGPVTTFESKKIGRQTTNFKLGIHYLLFNKKRKYMALDKNSHIGATLTTYSKNPVLKTANVRAYLLRHLMARVARNACPRIAMVQRSLYSAGSESDADKLVEQGIEMASNGQWQKAGDTWRKAILTDKSNALAHHNLGVYYERTGRVPESVEEFEKSRIGQSEGEMHPNQYDVSVALLRPKFTPQELEPHIYGVSGANWVSIYGGTPGQLQPGKIYSVYRTRRLQEPKSYRVDGMELIEIGRIRIIKEEPPFMLGRIIEFVEPERIEIGDVIMM